MLQPQNHTVLAITNHPIKFEGQSLFNSQSETVGLCPGMPRIDKGFIMPNPSGLRVYRSVVHLLAMPNHTVKLEGLGGSYFLILF